MATITIRGIDDKTHRMAKVRAVQEGMTLKDWVMYAIGLELSEDRDCENSFPNRQKDLKKIIEDIKLAAEVSRIQLEREAHADNCKCFICKPPKEK